MRQDQNTKAFDLRTTIRDPKTGKVVKEQPYIFHDSKQYGSFYEAEGKFYNRKGEEIEDPRIPHSEAVAKRVAAALEKKQEEQVVEKEAEKQKPFVLKKQPKAEKVDTQSV